LHRIFIPIQGKLFVQEQARIGIPARMGESTGEGTVEGGTMSGEAQMGDFGAMEWAAKKK
jgi:hypothetical protein